MGTNLGTTVLTIYTNLLGEILRINIKLKKKFTRLQNNSLQRISKSAEQT